MPRTATLAALVVPFTLLCAAPTASQDATSQERTAAPAKKGRKILKREVDGLIRFMRSTQREDGTVGDGSCRMTAMTLTAAGHCHRFYHGNDAPWFRNAIKAVFGHRKANGSFDDGKDRGGPTRTTAWVVDALSVMDPEGFREEIRAGNAFLKKAGQKQTSPFTALLTKIHHTASASADVADGAEKVAGEVLAQMPRGIPMDESGKPDVTAAARALNALVACQVIARGAFPEATPVQHVAVDAWTEPQQKGFDFLMTQQRGGMFVVVHGGREYPDVGLTGIGLAALLTKPAAKRSDEEKATIGKGLAWLAKQQGEDGAFGQQNVNYSTCAAVMALVASQDPSHAEALKRAQRYILVLQNIEEKGYGKADRDYGSIGYGGDERGDLSNLQFSLQALRETGLGPDHEAFKKALVFIQRTQNLREVNDFKGQRTRDGDTGKWQVVAPGNDGGASYYPGNSPAGYVELADGTKIPRSYGSMTYALLKAYTMCGLPADDPRVKAAVQWIGKNWTLDVNPGADSKLGAKVAYQGLYYYYMVMAQALDTVGTAKLTIEKTASGDDTAQTMDVDWRAELTRHLAAVQRDDGSWLNERNGRWWENQPLVCTVYAMLALDRCQ